MPDTAEPAGRRANGLQAADWGALVDLDPRLSESLLDRLAAAGVAAYVEPATAVDTVHRAVTLPSRPLDRLWIDPARADSARAVLASEVADLTALLAEDDPDATVHGLVHPVPHHAARRVLPPPALPGPPAPRPGPRGLPVPAPPLDTDAAPPAEGPPAAGPPEDGAPAPGKPAHGAPAPGNPAPGNPAPGNPAPRGPEHGNPKPGEPASDSPGPADPWPAGSDDDVFAQLVAQFHSSEVFVREHPGGGPAGPAVQPPGSPGLPGPARPRPVGSGPPGGSPHSDAQRRRRSDPQPPLPQPPLPRPPVRPPGDTGRGPVDPLPPWLEPAAIEDDGHFVPPPPPPVPRLRLRTVAAVVALVLGLLALFAPALLGLSATSGVGLVGLALLAGGAAALVWWMRDSSDSGPDDGAVV